VCYCGDLARGESALQPLRSFGPPLVDMVEPMPCVAVQSLLDAAFPHGNQHYWKSAFVGNLNDEALEVLAKFTARRPSPLSIAYQQQLHGAAGRVPPGETAFQHRGHHYDFGILAQWTNTTETEANIAWARDFFRAMEPLL
jgi:hypothetical protein